MSTNRCVILIMVLLLLTLVTVQGATTTTEQQPQTTSYETLQQYILEISRQEQNQIQQHIDQRVDLAEKNVGEGFKAIVEENLKYFDYRMGVQFRQYTFRLFLINIGVMMAMTFLFALIMNRITQSMGVDKYYKLLDKILVRQKDLAEIQVRKIDQRYQELFRQLRGKLDGMELTREEQKLMKQYYKDMKTYKPPVSEEEASLKQESKMLEKPLKRLKLRRMLFKAGFILLFIIIAILVIVVVTKIFMPSDINPYSFESLNQTIVKNFTGNITGK